MNKSLPIILLSSLLFSGACQQLPQPEEKDSYITAIIDGVQYAGANDYFWKLEYCHIPEDGYWTLISSSRRGNIELSNTGIFCNKTYSISFYLEDFGKDVEFQKQYYFNDGKRPSIIDGRYASKVSIEYNDNSLKGISGWIQIDSIDDAHIWGQFEFEGGNNGQSVSIKDGYFRMRCNETK